VNILLGDASKARRQLGWSHKVDFRDLVREMVEADCQNVGVPLNAAPRISTVAT
jgi:GDPmannose 4,6-dehydratase